MLVPMSSSDFRSASGALNAMKVNETKTAKLFHMMSSTLYTDKFMSILRELASNARDSHAEAGKLDVPFAIIAPSSDHLQLVISDAGTGITYELAQKTILEFLSSTKDEGKAAEEMIGGWGIGAKTPRAYADNYQVHLRKGGTEWLVQVINDASGLPMEMLMDERKTHRPDGVDFVVPIQPIHVNQWRDKIKTYLARTNYNVVAYMGAGEVLKSTKPYRTYDFGFFSLDAHGTPWDRGTERHTVEVVYGGMVYQIPTEFQTQQLQSSICEMVKKGLSLSIRLDKANAIKCGLSREQMEVDEANKNLILKALMLVEEDLKLASGNVAYRGSNYISEWSRVVQINEEVLKAQKENSEKSKLSAISASKAYELTWCPEGLLKDNYGRGALATCYKRLSLPLEEDYVPTVYVKYGPNRLLRDDIKQSSGIDCKLECPILTDDLDVVIKWATSLPHYKGVNFHYEEVESSKTARSGGGSKGPRLSYVVCDATKQRHNLRPGSKLLAVPSADLLWVGELADYRCFVPTKSLKYRQLPDDSVVMLEDFMKTQKYEQTVRKLAGAEVDDETIRTLLKALRSIEVHEGPQSVLDWEEEVAEKVSSLIDVIKHAKERVSAVEKTYGKQTLPIVRLEGIDEALKESNRLIVFLERNRDLFKVIDFKRLNRELEEGNPEATRLLFAMNLGQYQ